MKLYFEYADERSIIHSFQPDQIAIRASEFIRGQFNSEIVYIHRWNDGFNYDGTAHSQKETILIQIRDNTLYCLNSLNKDDYGHFSKGRPLSACKATLAIPLSKITH